MPISLAIAGTVLLFIAIADFAGWNDDDDDDTDNQN